MRLSYNRMCKKTISFRVRKKLHETTGCHKRGCLIGKVGCIIYRWPLTPVPSSRCRMSRFYLSRSNRTVSVEEQAKRTERFCSNRYVRAYTPAISGQWLVVSNGDVLPSGHWSPITNHWLVRTQQKGKNAAKKGCRLLSTVKGGRP